jgi:predicted NUDIX family NTP pyrophosphohydrolase
MSSPPKRAGPRASKTGSGSSKRASTTAEARGAAREQNKVSAGLLMCRPAANPSGWEFLLAHPGGPFFVRKDEGVWTIPKGLVAPGEDLFSAARREFEEETGFSPRSERYIALGHVVQAGGKQVHAWAFVSDCDPAALRSNTFTLAWPPRSGKQIEVPEIDRAAFFAPEIAARKILPAQRPLLERALAAL